MKKLAISGVLGKMGQVLRQTVIEDATFEYIGGFDRSMESYVVTNINDLKDADVLIDFSTPKLLDTILEYGIKQQVALVLATTGYNDLEFEKIKKASQSIPIFYSANYSVGVYLLTKALNMISHSIDNSYDIEIIDKHHRYKKDAPSGTAIKLYDAINDGLNKKRELISGHSNKTGIHVHSLRLGNYVGEHEVILSNLNETISLTHIAHDKSIFAKGALKAAHFLSNKTHGLYGMDDLFEAN